MLVAASFDPVEMVITLVFDRDVDGFNVLFEAIVVFDGTAVTEYRSTQDVSQPDPQTVQLLAMAAGEFTGTGVRMTAIAPTGIVSVPQGTEWAGVSNLELPFP